MQRVGMNQHQLNQDELLRISRAISDTTRYALLGKIYFDQQITVPVEILGRHILIASRI